MFGESVSVMEGDSVTLYTGATEICEGDDIMWKYGAENSLIAKIKRRRKSSPHDIPDERFRDRTSRITNTRTEHAGVSQLEISGANLTLKTFSVSVW